MTKIQFPKHFPTPISEGLHNVLEASGYELVSATPLRLEYEKAKKKISFSDVNGVVYEILQGCWQDAFRMTIKQHITDYNMMEILNAIGAIDYTKLKEFKTWFRENIHSITTQNQMSC